MVYRQRQCGLLDRQGHWVVTPRYSRIDAREDGWLVANGDGEGLLDPAGKLLIRPGFDSIGRFQSGLATARPRSSQRDVGYINRQGDWVLSPDYFIAGDFSEGLAVVEQWIGGPNDGHAECRYIKPDGKDAFADRWSDCHAFRFGMAVVERGPNVRTRDNLDQIRMAVLDHAGKPLLPWGSYWRLDLLSADRVLAQVSVDHWRLLDPRGRELYRTVPGGWLDDAGEGRLYYAVDDDRRGLLDMRSGKPLVTPAQGWSRTRHFSGGVAWVSRDASGWELIDRQGRTVLPATYTQVDEFSAGAAPVSSDGNHWLLIDRQGKPLTEALYNRMTPAWNWGPQTPRPGDVWQAYRDDEQGRREDWIDAHGTRLASVETLACGIEAVRDGHGEVIWPEDPEAECLAKRVSGGDASWLPPPDSGVDEARLMAVRTAQARQDIELLGRVIELPFGRTASTDSPQQQLLQAPWQRGPATIRLDDVASLDLPAGYRYLAPEYVPALRPLFGDRAVADDDGLPVAMILADDQVVLLRMVVLRPGHVSVGMPPDQEPALQERMEERLTGFGGTRDRHAHHSIDWLRPPRWDAAAHRLDLAYSDFTLDGGTDVVDSLLLGRDSVIQLRAQRGGAFAGSYALLARNAIDRLAAGIRFDPGQAWEDWSPGERGSGRELVSYLTTADAPVAPPAASESRRDARSGSWWPIVLVLVAAVAGGLWLVVRRRSARP